MWAVPGSALERLWQGFVNSEPQHGYDGAALRRRGTTSTDSDMKAAQRGW
jgi:hypothetical protein